MKDWRGTEIKAGDTIVFVQVRPEPHEEQQYVWKAGCEYEVFLNKLTLPEGTVLEYLAYTMQIGGHKYVLALDAPFGLSEEETGTIICIKGKSDDQEVYYTEYFKA